MPLYYRYGQVEAALAEVFKVGANELGALRGRLRHLRNIGVPALPNPGSGRQIRYSREAAIEMLLALELAGLGIAPRHAATYAKAYAKPIASGAFDDWADGILMTMDNPFGLGKETTSQQNIRRWFNFISTFEGGIPRCFAIINTKRSVEVLDEALNGEQRNT